MNYSALHQQIKDAKHILISTHKSPDGDAVGSALGLYHFLKSFGKKDVEVLIQDKYADNMLWLSDVDKINIVDENPDFAEELIHKTDLLFIVDYNAFHRAGFIGESLSSISKENIVLIDHHPQPDDIAKYLISDTSKCSASQMVYEFIKNLGELDKLTIPAGEAIYTGIMTDTGSFRFPQTSSDTHRIIADLLDLGVQKTKIHQSVYDTRELDGLKLLGYALSEKLLILDDCATGIISLTADELARFNNKKGYTEGLVNYALSVKGIKMAVFLADKDGKRKMSFRSKGKFSVNDFARNYFDGGGHVNAAGGMSMDTIENTLEKIIENVKKHKNEIINS